MISRLLIAFALGLGLLGAGLGCNGSSSNGPDPSDTRKLNERPAPAIGGGGDAATKKGGTGNAPGVQ
jgi:hypothetical protein